MGIIYLDIYTTSHGLEKRGIYLSFSYEPITISRFCIHDPFGPYHPDQDIMELIEDREYRLRTHYRIWWDQDAHDMGKPFIDRIPITITIKNPHVCPYEQLYNELKQIYRNYKDVWEEQRC